MISLLLFAGLASAVGEPCRTTVTEPVEVTTQTDTAYGLFPFNDNETVRYSVAITFRNASFSGICMVRRANGVIAGSVVNEFGVMAFDFTMTGDRRRARLLNVMKPLDKCLIRKMIAKDLRRLFNSSSADGHVSEDGDKVILRMRNRSYCFSKMNIPG